MYVTLTFSGIRKGYTKFENSMHKDKEEDEVCDDNMPRNTQLLLQSTLRLLCSHNSAVVLAAVGVHWLLAPESELKRIVKPLLFLMRSSLDCQYVVMIFFGLIHSKNLICPINSSTN